MGTFAMKKSENKSDYIIVLGAGLLKGDQLMILMIYLIRKMKEMRKEKEVMKKYLKLKQ